MPQNWYAANLANLAAQSADLAAQLDSMPMTNVRLLPLDGAEDSLSVHCWSLEEQQWIVTDHPTKPMEQAKEMAAQMWSRDQKIFTLLGLGGGYFAAAIAALLEPWQRLCIFEPDVSMYKAAMHAVDMAIFKGRAVHLCIGDDVHTQLDQWFLSLEAVEKLRLCIPFRSGYTQHCRKVQFDTLEARCNELLRFHAVGMSTWRQFGQNIAWNDIANIPEAYANPTLHALQGLWQDKPAVCIAAGPSLNTNLHWLLDPVQRDKVCVIAVGSVYATLTALGIRPDIVTAIDFQRCTWTDQFQHLPLDSRVALVYLHSVHPQAIRRWPGPRFVSLNASDLVQWFKQHLVGDVYDASDVQTVAHLNLHIALLLGANPIILLGQDLAMGFSVHHAPGARSPDQTPEECPEAHIDAVDYLGQPTHTRHSFLSMKMVFEKIFAAHPDRTFLNCTEGGLAIAGSTNQPFGETLQNLSVADSSAVLQAQIAQRFYDYSPRQHKLEDMQASLEEFSAQIERCLAWNATTKQACAAWDADPTDEAWAAVQACDGKFTEWSLPLAAMIMSRFVVLDMLSQVPLPTTATQDEQRQFLVDNLCVMTAAADEVLPGLRGLLTSTRQRFAHVCQVPCEQSAYRAWLRQRHVPLVVRSLRAHPQAGSALDHRDILWLLQHTQQFAAVVSLAAMYGLEHRAWARRAQRHLGLLQQSVGQLAPQYTRGL